MTSRKSSDVRLLPAVIAVGAVLFALKAGGLAFSANAAQAPAAKPATEAPAKPAVETAAKPAAAPADPLTAINQALPVPAKSAAPKAPPPDQMALETSSSAASAAEIDVLTSLADRRNALEQRQRELDLRANMIAAAEKRVDGKIAELKTMQSRIETLLAQRDAKELEQIDGLVKVYTAMKPKDAARIFASLDESVRLGVTGRMKPDIVAGILSSLPAEVAQKLTLELASRYKVPGMASAADMTAAAAMPAPAPPVAPPTPAPSAGPARAAAAPPGK